MAGSSDGAGRRRGGLLVDDGAIMNRGIFSFKLSELSGKRTPISRKTNKGNARRAKLAKRNGGLQGKIKAMLKRIGLDRQASTKSVECDNGN